MERTGTAERTQALAARLEEIVGRRHVLTGEDETRWYRTGYRFGSGRVLAVVRPGTLLEQWRVLQACVDSDAIVIMQAANTGLTGGSTPAGDDYDRPIVIISTQRLGGVQVIDGGRQVVCLPGSTLYELERELKPLGREPHSVIGSSCIGASVIGGIANNSGGALIRRGPAYTELSLYAARDADGTLRLVNHLGIDLGDNPETMLQRLDRGDYGEAQVQAASNRAASDGEYARHVRDVAAATPARYNADQRRLFEASGSAGKVAIFAVRLDTFAAEADTRVFYIGTNDAAELTQIRRRMLTEFDSLPIAAEYLHRDAFTIAEIYGKDTFLAIERLGTDRLPRLFKFKAWLDGVARRVPFARTEGFSDRVLQQASRLFPSHLPQRMRDFRDRYAHHLMVRVSHDSIEATRHLLGGMFPTPEGDYFECTAEEGTKAFLHRFAVAGAAVRYRAVHPDSVEDIVALDIALRRNDEDWMERLPPELEAQVLHKLYYGHFFCHVFHQDYVVAKGHDTHALELRMLKLLDDRGAEYPAEHNVGHLYPAKAGLAGFYRSLDPCNSFNPGIGHTTKCAHWQVPASALP